ncbi:C-type lectin domain family 14 member A [Corvus cornix cornix]|uniref:C-type lectin domain family 14 member A n=1 Tax=Corvus cornix cornix TaxID=932674 RepID=UPI00194EE598|nr:C-type lectin domain family 14 member A [Corvus cornix cornix]
MAQDTNLTTLSNKLTRRARASRAHGPDTGPVTPVPELRLWASPPSGPFDSAAGTVLPAAGHPPAGLGKRFLAAPGPACPGPSNKRRMPRSAPAPDTFPPAGLGEGRGNGVGAGEGRRGRQTPAQAGSERHHSRRAPQPAAGMRRAGPWCLLLAAASALARTPPRGPPCAARPPAPASAPPRQRLVRRGPRCLRPAAGRPRLGQRRGRAATAAGAAGGRSGPHARAVLGRAEEERLRLHPRGAAAPRLLLGGRWGWDGPQEVPAALGRWVQEPLRSCLTARCAGLHLARNGPRWGWKERVCQLESPGYLCRYQYEGACPDLSPAGALDLDYRLPFEEHSSGPGFSPPGTVLTVACPGGEVRFTCQPEPGGFAWKAAEKPLCPCPFGRRSPDSGRCAEAAGCRDAGRRRLCLHTGRPGWPGRDSLPGHGADPHRYRRPRGAVGCQDRGAASFHPCTRRFRGASRHHHGRRRRREDGCSAALLLFQLRFHPGDSRGGGAGHPGHDRPWGVQNLLQQAIRGPRGQGAAGGRQQGGGRLSGAQRSSGR